MVPPKPFEEKKNESLAHIEGEDGRDDKDNLPYFTIEKDIGWHSVYNLLRDSEFLSRSRIESLRFGVPKASNSIILLKHPPEG